MTKKLSIFNLLSVILLVTVSYYSQFLGINNNTIGKVSEQYETLFTPAGYAFSIWGLIYVMLVVYCIFQIVNVFSGDDRHTNFIDQTGPWFITANLSNSLWVVAWLYEEIWLSVILIFVALISLILIVIKTKMELEDVPLKTIFFVWWPICFYSGWLTVAAITNMAAYLSQIGWTGGIREELWAIIMLIVTVCINLLIIYNRNMREFAVVGVWALVAIYFEHGTANSQLAYTALGGAIIILIYINYHGYINRKTNPLYKLLLRKSR